jgi:hypothetical protein
VKEPVYLDGSVPPKVSSGFGVYILNPGWKEMDTSWAAIVP